MKDIIRGCMILLAFAAGGALASVGVEKSPFQSWEEVRVAGGKLFIAKDGLTTIGIAHPNGIVEVKELNYDKTTVMTTEYNRRLGALSEGKNYFLLYVKDSKHILLAIQEGQ